MVFHYIFTGNFYADYIIICYNYITKMFDYLKKALI